MVKLFTKSLSLFCRLSF